MSDPTRFILEIETLPGRDHVIGRLRGLVKVTLRSWGFRLLDCRPIPPASDPVLEGLEGLEANRCLSPTRTRIRNEQ